MIDELKIDQDQHQIDISLPQMWLKKNSTTKLMIKTSQQQVSIKLSKDENEQKIRQIISFEMEQNARLVIRIQFISTALVILSLPRVP